MTGRLGGVNVTMFAGGRGAATIARDLLGRPDVNLTLIINGYDNGQSTGLLRRLIPGLLGPSDFRKNLLLHLNPADPVAASMAALLNHRLPGGSTAEDLDAIIAALVRPRGGRFVTVPADTSAEVAANLTRVRAEWCGRLVDLSDVALGNLILAGAYLRYGRSFNTAVRQCARAFGTPAQLLNVTSGENAYLVARKADGRVLADESDIVGPQDAVPISDLRLVADPPPPGSYDWRTVTARPATVTLSDPARQAILDADLLVYGPGTPHSSLLPSFLTPGVADAIAAGRARARVFVVNTRADHDVQGLSPVDLVNRTLSYLDDPSNERGLVTHVLCPEPSAAARNDGGLRWIFADLTDPDQPGIHCGRETVEVLLELTRGRRPAPRPTLAGRS